MKAFLIGMAVLVVVFGVLLAIGFGGTTDSTPTPSSAAPQSHSPQPSQNLNF